MFCKSYLLSSLTVVFPGIQILNTYQGMLMSPKTGDGAIIKYLDVISPPSLHLVDPETERGWIYN